MGRPEPCILFAQSFIHSQLDEYVDEVVFSEPVVVTACEFLEQNASPSTPNISITGATSPPSFALELFVHCEGESRFRRLCQPFLYSHSSSNVLEVEAVVTSHLVLRGSYRSLTLVVYGNTAEDLGQFNLEFDLDNSLSHVVCSPSKGRLEDLPPALRSTKLTFEESLSSLGNLSFPVPLLDLTTEMKQFLLLVLKISQTCNNEDAFCKIVSIVVSFISSYVESVNGKSNPCDYHKMSLLVDGKPDLWHASHILSDAKSQLLELYNNHQLAIGLNQLLEGEIGVGPEGDKPTSELLMEMFSQCFPFLAKASVVNHPFFSQKKSIILALGVALIFCSSRESCFCFVSTGGMEQLVDLLCNGTENSPAIVLLLLHVFEAATCHGVGCEGFLGWWPREDEMVPVGNSDGYCHLLKLLLNRQRHDIASLATYILQRLRFYEIASKYESVTVSILANTSADSWVSSDGIKSLVSASSLLKQILKLLKCEPIEDPSPVAFAKKLYPHGQMEGLLSYGATVDFITSSNYAFVKNDVDTHLLFLLKERGFFPLSAALLSSPILRSEDRNIANVFIDIASSLESILLELLCSRSGLTFLLTESEATALLMYSLQANTNTSNIECLTLRQAAVFLSKGFFCRPQEAGMITDLHLRVGTAVDRLLRAAPSSDDLLWLLWELCAISRSDSGRQAVLAVGYFPEAVNILMEALQSCKTVEPIETGALQSSLAIFHSASEILEILVMDSTASSLRAWIRHAMELHKALHSASPGSSRKDAPTRLLEFIDAGVVYHQNGAIGLLKYAAVLASGGDAHLTSATVLVSDSIDAENIIGDSLNGSDSHVVDNLLGKLVSEKQLDGIALHDCSIVKLTTAFRILAFISDNSVVTASLYEEGAITLVYVVLVNCKFMLERLSSTYDYLVDEGTECNSTSDLLSERSHERSIIDLLVPCLVLLVNLLRKLQETKEQYRNKKLLNSLLKLHREISPKLVANSADLLYPYPSSALGFAAVCHLLTSALACWPVFGWTPGIFHHLLESVKATSLLALGPKDACSVLCLLGDLFPVEDIWQWRNEMPRLSALRTLGVGTILGPRAEHDVNWYLQPDQLAVLLVRLTPQLDRIAQLVLQLAFTTLLAIQDSLRVLIIRVACQRIECAIVLVRPMISWMDGHLSQSVLSDADIFKVYKLLSFAASLLEHFCAKPLLLKVGILRILQKALERCSNASHSDEKLILEESISLKDISLISWCLPTFKSLALIFSSRASSCHSELDEKCFDDDIVTEDYSVVAHHLLKLCQVLPVGRELLACMLAFKEFVSSNWGFCAVSSILSRHDSSHEECGPDERDTNGDVPDELDLRCFPFFLNCLKKLSRFMNSKDWGLTLVVEILNALAMNALFLAKEDEISEGLPILKSLFGLPHGIDEAKGSYNQKLRYVQELIEDIEQKVSDDGYFPSSGGARTWHQVKQALRSILILLEHSASSVAKFEGVDFSEEFNSPSDLVHSVIITSRLMQPITLTSMDDGAGLLFSDVWESSGNIDTIGSDLFGSFADRYVWECPYSPPDRQLMPLLSVKRKLTAADGSGKRARDNSGLDAIGSSMPSRSVGTPGISSGPTRRDTFRQRKPNTSRPPSMHVDDYVARERNIDSANSGSNVGNTTLRGSGRPPSIHVDEFMARQRERQHSMSMVVGDASQFRDVSEVRILSQENSKNPDKLEMPRQMKADLDDDQEINIVFDEEPEPDDRLPFPQTDDSLQPSAVVGESSPGSVVEESEGDPNQSIHRYRLGTPPTSEDVGSRSDVPLKRSTSRPEMSMIHDVSSSQKIFAGPSMDKTILREQSDESKYASPRRFDTLAATNSTGFPSHSTNVCSTPSSIQPSALLNYHQKSSPQKASDSLLPVGVQGYSEQKLPANQPPLPPMPPPTRLAASAQAADSVQNLSSPYLQTIREMQPPLPTGYPLQSVSTSGNSNASGLHHQMENISSVGNSSASSLTTPQPIMDSKYSWNMVSSASKLQAESFIPSTSVRTMPPLPPLPPPFSSPNVQSSAANSSPQTSLSHPQPSDANFGVFPPPGSTLASYAIPPFSTSLLIGRPPSSPGNLFASQTQQHGQNSSSLNRSAPGPQSSVQSMQPRPPPPPPPQLPRPLHPPQHPLPSIQVSQPQPEQVMQQQQSPFQLQMQPLQIPQQLHIPQIQFYYHQPPPQEPHLQALQPFLDQTQSAGFQADNAPQHQKESGMTLQQYFSSPEAIQSLLSDRDKLCQLLEQHPKLMQMLQERLGQQ